MGGGWGMVEEDENVGNPMTKGIAMVEGQGVKRPHWNVTDD